MKKDALYRLKNQERMPWRTILYGVAKRFQALTRSEPGAADTSAFILDDTADARVGRRIENVSYIFDHVVGKTTWGFKHLVLGFFDGTTFTPLDFSIHAEKRLRGKPRKDPYKKPCTPGSPGYARRKECTTDKIA